MNSTTTGIDYFVASYGKDAANKGFVQIPNCFLFCKSHLGLTDSELIALIYLLTRQFTPHSKPYMGIKRMSADIGKGESAMRENLRRLEKKGFIQREFRTSETNKYDLSGTAVKLSQHLSQCVHNPIDRQAAGWRKAARARYQKSDSKEKEPSMKNSNKKSTPSVGLIMRNRNA